MITETTGKASITLPHLKRALKVVERAIGRGAAIIPFLQSIRMEQLPDGLAIEATNLDIAIRALVGESNGPAKPLVIPAERILSWVNLLKGDEVTINTTTTRATVSCGRPRAVFPLLNADGWPIGSNFKIEGGGITLKQDELGRALRFTAPSVSEDVSRGPITGVQINGDGERLRFVSTNGYCLALYTLNCADKINDLLMPASLIHALQPLLGTDGGIDLACDEKSILATVAGDEMAVFVNGRKLLGTFPSWQAVYPKDKRTAITVDAGDLLESLARCAQLADAKSGSVLFTFGADSEFTIDSADAAAGEAREVVTCTGAVPSEFRTRINGEFLINILKKLNGPITIQVPTDNAKPLLFKAEPHEGETLDYIVMPMRV